MSRLLTLCIILMASAASAQSQSVTQEAPDCAEVKARVARMESRLQDWPFLGRYREMNAKTSPPGKDEKRVVFFGDSITDSWKLGDYFTGKPYVNRGIGGQTTPQMLIRFRPDVIQMKPKVVVILAGTNDIAGNIGPMTLANIEDNLASIAELSRVNGINVVLASLLPVSDYEKNKEGKPIIQTTRRPPDQIKALNEWIKKYADQNGLTYLDYYSATVDEKGFLKDELSDDGLHPNSKGYEVMAPLAEQAITVALKKKK